MKAPDLAPAAPEPRRTGFHLTIVGAMLFGVALATGIALVAGFNPFGSSRTTINDLKRVRAGTNVELSGIVTFVDPLARVVFFQDQSGGLRLELDPAQELPTIGEAIELTAVVAGEVEGNDAQAGSSALHLEDVAISAVRRRKLPEPQAISISDQFSSGGLAEARLVQTEGIVRAAVVRGDRLSLELADSGIRMPMTVLNARHASAQDLIDARVRVQGVLQLNYETADVSSAGTHLWIADPTDLEIVTPPPKEIARAPSIWSLISDRSWADRGYRVRVQGNVVNGGRENVLLIENAGIFIPIETAQAAQFAPGERVEAVGWPNRSRFTTLLQRADVTRVAAKQRFDSSETVSLAPPITNLSVVRALKRERASSFLPVDITGVVTAVQVPYQLFFLQAGKEGIFVDALDQSLERLTPGLRIRVRGFTAAGDFAPVIRHPRIEVLGQGELPLPQHVDAADAPTGTYDSEWVVVEGLMRPFATLGGNRAFKLIAPFGTINGTLIQPGDPEDLDRFVDARVRVRGVFATVFTKQGVLVGYRMFVQSPEYFEILQAPPGGSSDAEPKAIAELLRFQPDSRKQRARIRGTVIRYSPRRLYVQDETGSVLVHAAVPGAKLGDVVEVTGYPAPSDHGPILADASVVQLGATQALEPKSVTADEILRGALDSQLVRIEAKVLSHIPGTSQQMLVLQNGYTSFNAILDRATPLPELREGTVVSVTGVCAVQRQLFQREEAALPVSFRILLRTPEDVQIIQAAPWWTAEYALPALAILTLSICLAMLWVAALRRRVQHQTAEIESQRTFLRQVLDMCPNFIFVKDRDGRFSLVNRAFAQARGKVPSDLIGKTDVEIGIDPNHAQAYGRDDAEVLRHGRDISVVEPYTDVEGRQLWLQTFKRPLTDDEGRPAQILAVANDITLHKHAEETMRKAREAAEAANRAKSEFLANMSHEIRTPLNGIIGMTSLWLETEMTREQREYLDTVKLSADGLLGVINDVLDFSKIEAGRLEIDPSEFDLRDALEWAVKTLALRAHEKGLELVCDVAPDMPDAVCGDANRLRQVLLNLAGNAIKFTSAGEVVVRASLQSRENGCCTVHFSVSDTGIGIEPSRHASIFDPFVQADSSTTRHYGGTGLGLTISSRLVAMMGGRMWLESELGSGSVFHFTLPFRTVRRSLPADAAAPLQDAKVLLLDPNASSRAALGSLLSRWKVRTVACGTLGEAVQALNEAELARDPMQVTIVDMSTRQDDAFELIRTIQGRPDLSPHIIRLVPSTARREDEAHSCDAGAETYVVKPVRAAEIRKVLLRFIHDAHSTTIVPTSAKPPSSIRSASLHVLLAEDNRVNQMLMVRLLEKRGHRITVASNGRIALEALEKEPFDLVLMDVQMPELDGLAAAQEIRRREESTGQHTPIIALTAHAMTGDRERCLAAGMDGYLTKPINIKELDEVLQRYGPSGEIAPRPNTGTAR